MKGLGSNRGYQGELQEPDRLGTHPKLATYERLTLSRRLNSVSSSVKQQDSSAHSMRLL